MQSNIALVLCLVFVLYLLVMERRQSARVTGAVWVPTIWMLYISSKPLAYWFPSSVETPGLSPLDRAFLIVLLLLALAILVRRSFDWGAAMRDNRLLIFLLAFMLISVLWSQSPGTTFIRWIREVQAALMAFVLLSEPSPRAAMESILRRTTYVLVPFSLLLIKYFPVYGRSYSRWSGDEQWIGVTLQKNGLGRLCLVAIIFLLWTLIRRAQGRNPAAVPRQTFLELVVLMMTLWVFKGPGIKAYSATALGALALGLAAYWGISFLKKRGLKFSSRALTIIIGTIMALGVLALFYQGSFVGSVAPSFGRDATLTDRVDIWRSLLPMAMQRPLLGSGYGGFWTLENKANLIAGEGHNGYLDVLLDLGFVGLILIFLFYLQASRRGHAALTRDFDWGLLSVIFLVAAVVHNITESSLSTFTTQLTAVILFLSVIAVKIDASPAAPAPESPAAGDAAPAA